MKVAILYLAVAFIGLAACNATPSSEDVTAREADFAAQKASMKAKIDASPGPYNATLDCAAKRVSDNTARTQYLLFLYNRPDLTTEAGRTNASHDWIDSIDACGGDMTALANEMGQDDDDLIMKGLVIALIRQGR